MRQYFLLAAIPVSFLAGAWLGYAVLPEKRQVDATPDYTTARPQAYARMPEEQTQPVDTRLPDLLSERMDVIHSELRAMNASLDQLLTNHRAGAPSFGESNTVDNISSTDINATNITADEIVYFQDSVIARLADPGFNLDKLNAMPEYRKLPEADKIPVLNEIARRLDSGEVAKSSFLPGYDPASE